MEFRVLAVTDEVDPRIYSTTIRERMADIDIVIGCGDLPASYLEFLTDALHREVFYVLGNHAEEITRVGERGHPRHPEGCTDLGFRVAREPVSGLILAGLPGSPRYTEHDPVQYTETTMLLKMLGMAPRLIWNRLRHGRAIDILVTHAPPRDVGDRDDPAHRGFRVFHPFIRWTKPKYHVHGHVHLYDRTIPHTARLYDTEVINVYPYQRLLWDFDHITATPSSVQNPAPDSLRAAIEHDARTAGGQA